MELDISNALITFLASELTKPVMRHVFNFTKEEHSRGINRLISFAYLNSNLEDKYADEFRNVSTLNYNTLLICSDIDFKNFFRMTRCTMEELLNMIKLEVPDYNDDEILSSAPYEMTILLTVWLLGSNTSYERTAQIFGLSEERTYLMFLKVCRKITKLAHKFIIWPNPEEKKKISDSFETEYGFSGIIGAIGNFYTAINNPDSDDNIKKYKTDGKDNCSVFLQAVCDDNFLLRYVSHVYPGNFDALSVFKKSSLHSQIMLKNTEGESNTYIIGSSEFPQMYNLLTPYSKKAGVSLTEFENNFNKIHQEINEIVERCFTFIKEKFPRLTYIEVSEPEHASDIIIAACVLYNFTIAYQDY